VTQWVAQLPWLIPGCLLAIVVSTLASSRVAHWLGCGRPVAWALLMSVGVIVAGTLTPLAAGSALERSHPGSCDLSRIGPPSFQQLLGPGDALGNILMLVPLGFVIAVLPRSRRKAAVLLCAAAFPVVIEATQLLVIPLGRACESADVVDNLTGLVLGLAAGAVAGSLLQRIRRTPEPAA
jgi:glycopeptide antibiotics resistance protein